MLVMDYRVVDILTADQLEIGDLIGLGNEVVKILSIETAKDGFVLLVQNDFFEKDSVEISDDEKFFLHVLD